MTLRLDPARPVLWRTPQSLQFGVGGEVVLDDVTPAIERLIAVLVAGTSHSGVHMHARSLRIPAGELAELLARLEPVLVDSTAPVITPRVAVVGRGAVADEVARQLEGVNARVALADAPELVVLVADHVVDASDHGRWLASDRAHLGVVVGADQVEVGPLVVPGAGACLYCVQLARRDADPAWPAIATQLSRLAPAVLARTPVVEAAALTVRRALAAGITPLAGDGLVQRLSIGDGVVSAIRVARHPACLCCREPGSDWAHVDAPAPPGAPSSTRVDAVRA